MKNKKLELEFKNGLMQYKDVQLYLIPINSFLVFFNELMKIEDKEYIINLIRKASEIDSRIIYNKINLKYPTVKKIQIFLKTINNLGIGEIKLKSVTKNKVFLIQEKTILSNGYYSLYKNKPKILFEEIAAGYIQNLLSLIYERKIICKIIHNLRKKSLVFECTITNQKVKQIGLKHTYQDITREHEVSNSLKKTLINNNIKIKNGIFTIWNMYGILIPYFYFIELTKNLPSYYLNFFEILGRLQGKAATDAQRFFYGLSGEKLFLEVSSQAEISAMGRISILSLDDGLKYKIYNNLNSFFSQYYSNKNFEFILTYFRNNVRGVFESSYDYTTNLVVESDLCNLEIINNSFKKLSKKEEEIDKYINLKALMSNISLQ